MIAKPSVAVLVFMLGACAAPVLAAPQLYLSWGAPYGEPGATSTLEAACDDSARVDTLYLSFEIDKLRPGVARMEATLTFTPLHGDTLLPFWSFQSGWPNQGNLLVDFVPFVERFCPAPWGFFGDGDVRYDHRGERGRLAFRYALSPQDAQSLRPNTKTCFARVRIRHRRTDLKGCAQPVCVEWTTARIGFSTGREMDLEGGSNRFATWNLPAGASCGSQRWDPLARPWQPKPKAPGRN